MKRLAFASLAMLLVMTTAQAQQTTQLPAPDKTTPMTLMQTLQIRHSVRDFAETEITDTQLSQLLWMACGINRPERSMITAPSAVNMQDIKVYVCRKDGAWLYEPKDNSLTQMTTSDLRASIAGPQADMQKAPVNLVLVSDQSRRGTVSRDLGYLDAGYVSQNICLGVTALGLATVPRVMMDAEAVRKGLNLNDKQLLIANHPVGYERNTLAFSVTDSEGKAVVLNQYRGQVMLIVNTASKCGFTPQFDGLEKLYQQYKDRGLVVLGFPCNQFAGQDPGTNKEIVNFCRLNYGVTFPMMGKIDVNGADADKLFVYLKSKKGFAGWEGNEKMAKLMDQMLTKNDPQYKEKADIKWNFTKFLIDRNGNVVKRFEPTVEPAAIAKEIEALL